MAENKRDIYAKQCQEDLILKSKIKDILVRKTRIGVITNDIYYLVKDEIKKLKEGAKE